MKAKVYLQLAEACERTAATADLPETKAGMLASATVWRRLAMAFSPSDEARSITRRDKLAVLADLEARSFSASSILPLSAWKN
jgi:hypothetical protein